MNADAVTLGSGPDLRPRTADGWGLGSAMSLGVHLVLVAALALGVRWKMSNPEVVEAEVWSAIPRAAAPSSMAPPPTPVAPAPAPALERAEPPEPAKPPEIVTARTPPKKEAKKPKHPPREVFDTSPPKPVKKAEKPVPKPKPEVPPPVKVVPNKARDEARQAQEAAERAAIRQDALQRMMSNLGNLGTSSRSSGPTAAYAGRIKARIKPNIVFTDDVSGNPRAVAEVRCAPDGRIIARRLIQPSGVASWDDAVLRAIDRTEVLPADESGRVPAVIEIEFKPKDF